MALLIPCPECGAELKLRDRSMLGRTGKCPKCDHRFTLADPDEVELELAAEQPVAVAAARRVVEQTPAAATSPGRPADSAASAPFELPMFPDATSRPSSTDVLDRGRRGPSRRAQVVLGAVLAVAAAGVVWIAIDSSDRRPEARLTEARPKATAAAVDRDRLESMAGLIASDHTYAGEPISLKYVPAGTSVVIHLRPVQLWKAGSTAEETRFCLGDSFVRWSEERIKELCLLPPAEIEEATICLILGARGTAPQVAAVVRPASPLKRSQLIEKFGGRLPNPGESVYVGQSRAFAFGREEDAEKRPLVFASVPAGLAGDLALVLDSPGLTNEAMHQLLTATDHRRQLTVAFRPTELRIHEEALVPKDLRGLWELFLDGFDDDVEAAAWSVDFSGGDLVSELVLRNDPATHPRQLHSALRRALDGLPERLLDTVTRMRPAAVGNRKLIGRFPAMVELLAASTVSGATERAAVFQSRLSERAAPNLALAALLTWDESTRTRAGSPTTEPSPGGAAPGTLAERLKKPVDVDFRRTPLEEAFAYLGGETGVEFEVDGDALKFAGYTRNMPQTFNLGRVPAERAVAEMLKPPQDKLAVVLDEANGKAVVTTKAVAQEKGLTPSAFTP